MNDYEEVRFGITQANEIVLKGSRWVNVCRTPERAALFQNSFANLFERFATEHIFDVYVFSLSNHSREDKDGRLSMYCPLAC
jgi:hypothetical protein